ncbi:MAG: hypothetical protein AB2812_03510 [Candidatus Sedimenticola endophacoides]
MFAVAGASAVLADGASDAAGGQVQKAGNSSWVQQISLDATGSEMELLAAE